MEEFSGITVLITGIERLAAILDTFSPTLDCISPLGLEDVADHYATMIEVMEAPDNLKDIGDFAVLILETGQDIVLPLSAFEPVKITIDELEESRNFDLKTAEHLNPATMLAHNLAAELIQAAYRNYRARQQGKQLRRKISSDYIVQQLAAQTIVQNLKRVLSKTKNKISHSSLPPSTYEQSLNTASVESIPLSSIYTNPDEGHKQQISSPEKHSIPRILHNPRLSNVLEICDVSVHSVPSVVWNDKNSLYVVFRINGLNYRSATQYAAGEEAIWEGVLCCASMQNMLSKHGKDSKIVIELYNEHLAIKDKCIGQCEFSCASILDQTMACPIVEMTGEIMESAPTTTMSANRKIRGTVACTFRLNDGEPSESNWWPAGKQDKNIESVPATARSKIVDVNADNIPEINGMSPRTIRAAADVLNAWESTPKTIHQSIPAKTKNQESCIPRPRSGNTKTLFQKKPSKVSTRLMDGISHARDPIDQLDVQPAEEATSISGPNTARFSNITDDNHHNFVPMTATTSIAEDKKSNIIEYHHSKPHSSASRAKRLFHDILKSRQVPPPNVPSSSSTAPVIVDIQFFYDKCFTMAFQTICSNLEMSALEIVILLDSLGHPVAVHWLEEASVISSSASASQTMIPFPSLIVPISHPAAFADCICQYVQNYPDILDQSQYFRFTADHASLAITHLIRLLKGSYEEIRSEIFRASHGSKDTIKKFSSDKVPISFLGSIRPSRYDQSSCHQLLHLLQMPISVQDSVSHGHVLLTMDTGKANNSPTGANSNALPSFSSFGHHRISSMDSIASGTLLPQTVGTLISVGSMIKSSLKRARLTLYQATLRLLDSMWDKGVRPWDIYPPPSTDNDISSKTSLSSSHISAQPVTSSKNIMKRRKSYLSNTSQKSQKSNFSNSGSSFVIMEVGKLFDALVPINRAYGFGYSMQELSHLANTVGGFLCMKDLPFETNDNTKSTENSSLLWVKVLFPSKEIKHHALMILRQHLLSNTRSITHQEGNEAINGFIYLRQRAHSKPSLSSQVLLGHPNVDNDSRILSLTDEAVGASDHDDNVDILVHIPRICLGSTSIGVSKLLQMSRSKLDFEDVHLGMRLRVVDLSTLQRLCERYEWYDRPSPEILQKLATHRVEVISVAELHSKGRVGVKLLRDDRFCDALPLEALQSLPKNIPSQPQQPIETVETTVDDSNQQEEAIKKKNSSTHRKLKLKRRSSRDQREIANGTVATTVFSTRNVPTPVTTASLIADLAAMQQQQEQQREEIQKLKQKQEKLSKSTEILHQTANDLATAKNTMPSNKGKISSEEKEFDVYHDDTDHDETIRTIPQMTVHVKNSNVKPQRIQTGAPNTAISQTINKRPLSASITRSAKSSLSSMRGKPQSEEKDFSWLKPVEKLVEERMSQPQPTWAWPVVPPVGDKPVPPTIIEENTPVNHPPFDGEDKDKLSHIGQNPSMKNHKTNKSKHTIPPTLHHWQPSFTKETAEYTHGVYVYQNQPTCNQEEDPSHVDHDDSGNNHNHQNHYTTFEIPLPSSPLRPPGDKSGITDINPQALPTSPRTATSAFSPLRRPASAPAVERVAKKLKERQRQELEEQHKYTKFQESPTSPPTYGGLGLSGFGYTNDGRKESAAFAFSIDDKLYETSEMIAKQEKIKKTRKEKPINSRDASKTALKQLFGMNERHLEEEDDLEGHVNLNFHHLDEEKKPKVKPSNKRSSSAVATANANPNTKTAVRTTHNSPPSSPEGKYRDIELARSAKEATYKENYLLKQLRKLGV